MLNDRSPVPLYYQLQEIIRSRIESGQWRPGDHIPPEDELCKEFNLSKGTVRQALSSLVTEGLLYRRRGMGCFVADPKMPQDILNIAGFTAYAKQTLGWELTSQLISVNVVQANKALAEKLNIPAGADVIEIRKVKYAENRIFFLVTTYIPRAHCPGLETENHADGGSLFKLLQEKYGVHVTRVKGWFEPVLVSEYEANLLKVEKGSPAMMFERIRYTTGDKPLMFSKHIIRGDMCRLTFEISDQDHRKPGE